MGDHIIFNEIRDEPVMKLQQTDLPNFKYLYEKEPLCNEKIGPLEFLYMQAAPYIV
jgi:hypothetical protein